MSFFTRSDLQKLRLLRLFRNKRNFLIINGLKFEFFVLVFDFIWSSHLSPSILATARGPGDFTFTLRFSQGGKELAVLESPYPLPVWVRQVAAVQ
jgi:hypothetical protein